MAPVTNGLVGASLDGRFLLLEKIGSGGMGQVYQARQMPMERLVAVKVLSTALEASQQPHFQARFLREAAVTASLKHPNTVSVIDYGVTQDGVYFIAMELLEGRTLSKELKVQGALSWRRAVEITLQVCRSVREAHRIGLVHRDLKPANIMLLDQESDADVVKVLDFGLVKSFLGDDEVDMTQSGIFLGSPLYMGPEQARGAASPQSDIYSIGVVLFHMLAGVAPYDSKNSIDVIMQHMQAPIPRVIDRSPEAEVPEGLEAVVMRCLAKKPEDRYPSLDFLIDSLRQALDPNAPRTMTAMPAIKRVRGSPSGVTPSGTPLPQLPLGAEASSARSISAPIDVNTASGQMTRADFVPRKRTNWTAIVAINVAMLAVGAMVAMAVLMVRAPSNPPSVEVVTAAPVRPVPPVVVAPVPVVVEPTPAPTPPSVVEPATPATPGVVRFRVDSVPPGARVFLKGKNIGKTPFVLDQPEARDGTPTTLEVVLRLDGYQPQDVSAAGFGPEVSLVQRLARKGEAKVGPAVVTRVAAPRPAAQPVKPVEVASPVKPAEVAPQPRPTPVVVEPAPAPEKVLVDSRAPRTLPEDAEPPEPLESNQAPAMPAGVSGNVNVTVVVRFVVDVDGSVKNVELIKGDAPFSAAALAVVKTWKFEPARLDGRPLAVYKVQKVQFRSSAPSTPSFGE